MGRGLEAALSVQSRFLLLLQTGSLLETGIVWVSLFLFQGMEQDSVGKAIAVGHAWFRTQEWTFGRVMLALAL